MLGSNEAETKIIGVDLHARQQTIAALDDSTGELVEKELQHEGNEVREFYSALPRPTLVGIEATGSMHWFLRLLEELKIEYLVGHPAKIRAAEPRRQKNDRPACFSSCWRNIVFLRSACRLARFADLVAALIRFLGSRQVRATQLRCKLRCTLRCQTSPNHTELPTTENRAEAAK